MDADRALTTFRSGFTGRVSPVHFFWGAMDLAVTRFSGREAPLHPGGAPNCPHEVMVEGYSHEISSAGFWPGGGADGAYYSYAYPVPEGFADARVPEGAYWDAALGEFLLPYETVRLAADPDALVQSFLAATYRAAADLASWDAVLRLAVATGPCASRGEPADLPPGPVLASLIPVPVDELRVLGHHVDVSDKLLESRLVSLWGEAEPADLVELRKVAAGIGGLELQERPCSCVDHLCRVGEDIMSRRSLDSRLPTL